MKQFRFFKGNISIDDIISDGIYTPFNEWQYQNHYRWEVEGFEFVGVTPLYYDVTVSMLPIKKRLYKHIAEGTIIVGDLIRPDHPMYNHPNVINLNDE